VLPGDTIRAHFDGRSELNHLKQEGIIMNIWTIILGLCALLV